MTMTKRERVMAALGGKPVDRVPLAFWLHNFATENSAAGLATETLRLARTFDWDYLKPQSRAQCFAEMWGLRYQPSGAQAVQYTVLHAPVADAEGLRRLAPAHPRTGSLGEQLHALRAIREAVGPDTPIIWTIFSPLMVLPALLAGGREQALALLRAEPAAVERACESMTETLAGYAAECLAAGADGLFYATNMATRELITAAECRRFQRPWDLRILAAVAGGALQPAARVRRRRALRRVRRLPRHRAAAGRRCRATRRSPRRTGARGAPWSAACPPSPASRP